MQADHAFSGDNRIRHDLDDLGQGHAGGIVHRGRNGIARNQLAVHQAAGKNHHFGMPQETRAPDRDQVGRTRSGADELNFWHHTRPVYFIF
jgi:hypothetical protein